MITYLWTVLLTELSGTLAVFSKKTNNIIQLLWNYVYMTSKVSSVSLVSGIHEPELPLPYKTCKIAFVLHPTYSCFLELQYVLLGRPLLSSLLGIFLTDSFFFSRQLFHSGADGFTVVWKLVSLLGC